MHFHYWMHDTKIEFEFEYQILYIYCVSNHNSVYIVSVYKIYSYFAAKQMNEKNHSFFYVNSPQKRHHNIKLIM